MKHVRFATFLATAILIGLIGTATPSPAADCAPGFYSATGQDPCSPCPEGSYTALAAQTACQPCELGSYQDVPAKTSCNGCNPGTYADSLASTSCQDCATGTYTSDSGSSACQDCAVGKYADSEGSSICTSCDAGSYAGSPGAQLCDPCPRGTYVESPAASVCDDCAAGTYSPTIGAASSTTCQNCGVGEYGASPGQSACQACEAGTYSDTPARTVCLNCSPGTFASSQGSTACNACGAQTYAASPGASTCLDCPPLTYQPDTGASSCDDRDSVRCWKAKDLKNPKFVQTEGLSVSDDFADDTVDLKKADLFCAPVAVGGQPVTDSDPRRCCYKAKGDNLDPSAEIEVAGSLGGTLQLALKKPSLLCEQCQGAPAADPLRCWKVKDLKNPKFVKQETVSADDELASDTFDTKKPDLYCAPASVDGALVADAGSQLCCYKVKGNKLDPPAVRATTGDVGGSLELEMKKPSLLCEPCTKIDLP